MILPGAVAAVNADAVMRRWGRLLTGDYDCSCPPEATLPVLEEVGRMFAQGDGA